MAPDETMTSYLTDQGIAALKAGDKDRAFEFLVQALHNDQHNERAWLWLSGTVSDMAQRRYCLEWVLAINPQNAMAQKGLSSLPPDTGSSSPLPDMPADAQSSQSPAEEEWLPPAEPASNHAEPKPPAAPLPKDQPTERPGTLSWLPEAEDDEDETTPEGKKSGFLSWLPEAEDEDEAKDAAKATQDKAQQAEATSLAETMSEVVAPEQPEPAEPAEPDAPTIAPELVPTEQPTAGRISLSDMDTTSFAPPEQPPARPPDIADPEIDPEQRARVAAFWKLQPWRTVLTFPRETLRQAILINPPNALLALVMLAGINGIFTITFFISLYQESLFWPGVVLGPVLGPALGAAMLFAWTTVLQWVSGWLTGEARTSHVRQAIAWSSVPLIGTLPLWLVVFLMLGITGGDPFGAVVPALLTGVLLAGLLLSLLWSFWLFLQCLQEVYTFTTTDAAIAAFTTTLIVNVPAALAVLALVLAFEQSVD